jgi:hypothetical protein
VVFDTTVIADVSPLIEVIPALKGDWDVYKIYGKVTRNGLEFDVIPK